MKSIPTVTRALAMVLGIALLSAPVRTAPQQPEAPPTDAAFLQQVHGSGMAEIALADLARDRASKSEVKAFAAKLKEDHTRVNADVKKLAAGRDVALSTEINVEQKATHARFSKLDGSEFDRAYMDKMVADHRKAVETFTAKSTSGADDVKVFAAKTLPALKEHLQMALDVQKQVGN